MPSGKVVLERAAPVASDDQFAQVSISANTTKNVILSFRTPPGLIGYITDFRQAWDSGLDTFVSYYLRINGMIVYPYQYPGVASPSYNGSKVQIASPEQDVALPVPIRVEQLSLVEVMADQDSSGTTGNVTARVICKYFNPEDIT